MSTRNAFGKSLAAGITAFLGVKCLWNILMNLGILPIAGFTLPLISHGNTDFLLNMVLIGLALSIYRRRTLTGLPSNVVES
jgi:cell division protein FtsW (lipid II flippase)